jgi:Mor family transcriptional regulator
VCLTWSQSRSSIRVGADVAGGEPSGAGVAVLPDPVGPKAKHVALPLRNMKPTRSEIARSYTSQLSALCNGNTYPLAATATLIRSLQRQHLSARCNGNSYPLAATATVIRSLQRQQLSARCNGNSYPLAATATNGAPTCRALCGVRLSSRAAATALDGCTTVAVRQCVVGGHELANLERHGTTRQPMQGSARMEGRPGGLR